ncbi:hypothetical protein ACU4GI_20510 [Cupriavidus basilensis]
MGIRTIVAPAAKTKNDLYEELIAEGVKRNFSVIPEFRIPALPTKGNPRQKNIDLVWARRRAVHSKHATHTPCNNLCHWDLIAAFEIEGCNVNVKRIVAHSNDFAWLSSNWAPNLIGAVALYTQAYDRRWLVKPATAAAQVVHRKSLSIVSSSFHIIV